MKNIIKRAIAYIVDIMFVSLLATLLANTPINPNYDKIEKLNEEYEQVYEYYSEAIVQTEKLYLKENFNEENITIFKDTYNEYSNKIDKINEDQKFEKEEKSELLDLIQKDYNKKYKVFFYDMKKLSIFENILLTIIILLYFVGFAYIMNGETVGKKLMKLKIISNDNKKTRIHNYLIRTIIISGMIITFIDLILLYTLKESAYMNAYNYISFMSYALEFAIIFTTYFNKDNRGIHDILGQTIVIDLKKKEEKEILPIKEKIKTKNKKSDKGDLNE